MMSERIIQRLRQRDPALKGEGFSLPDFAYARGNVLDALVYLSVIWPSFVEVQDMVFRDVDVESPEDRQLVGDALDRLESKTNVERSFNWMDVGALFAPRNGESTDDDDKQLAGLLCEIWSLKLRNDFPGRDFTTEVVPTHETGGSYGVRFYENR